MIQKKSAIEESREAKNFLNSREFYFWASGFFVPAKIPTKDPNSNGAPKTFFKALFYYTPLGAALRRMLTAKSIPEGLKPQECERSSGRSKPPVSYIPEKDAAQDATHDRTMKVRVSEKLQLTVTVFHQGTPEQFLNHVQVALETISQRGLDTDYQLAIKEDLEAEEKLTAATEAKESYLGSEENPPVVKLWKKATAAKTRTSEAVASAIHEIFMQYSTLLSEEACCPWTKIVEEPINSEPYTNTTEFNIPKSAQRRGPPLWSVSNYTCRLYSEMMQQKRRGSTSATV